MEAKLGGQNNTEAGIASHRRKRRNHDDVKPRFFLAKQGSNVQKLELGDEVPTEGDALVRALKNDQPFYVVTAWRAVAEQNGKGPVIVKQAVPDKQD